ncbi:hypothetical protein NRV34_002371 [Staphylococcus pseudintermedius]|nr:hypothetical protein [Staphylococcus pseudintermedius]
MATFEVLKDCRDKKAKHLYRKDEKIEATVKAINEFERRLKKHTKISCEEIYDDRFLHSYFL